MRPTVKQEPGAGGAQELQQELNAVAPPAAGERNGQRRRVEEEAEAAGPGGTGLQLQLLRMNADVQAFALQGLERERAMGEQLLQAKAELLQAKAQVAELRAEIRIKDAALEAKDIVHKAEVAVPESKLQSPAAAFPPAPAPVCYCRLSHGSLGRYAADDKHVVSAFQKLRSSYPNRPNPEHRCLQRLTHPTPLSPPSSAVSQWLHLLQRSRSRRRVNL